MQAGVIASLTYAAQNGEQLFRNFYQKGENSIREGKEDSPKAFLIPTEQRDPAMAAYLVNQLRAQAIEVHQSDSGEYVVLLDQPYRNLAVTLLTEQKYPKEAKFPPYDDIAWTLSYLYDVKVEQTDSINDISKLKKIEADVNYAGKIKGEGNSYFITYQAQNTVLPALYWIKENQKNAEIRVIKSSFAVGQDTLAVGSILIKEISAAQANE